MQKKKYKYPNICIRVSPKHRGMIDVLKNKHYINISKVFRDTLENLYSAIIKNKGGI